MADAKPNHTSSYHLKRVLRLFAKVVVILLLLIVLIFILIQTPPVQNFARKKIESYLEGKLKTRVDIGKLYIGFPNTLSLQNVYIEDQQKDTLLSGGRLAVDISMFKLINGEVEINEIQLENITAKIKRQLPDTVFNFQFIVDAFAPKKTQTLQPNDTAAMKMAIKSVLLDKVRIIYIDVITGSDMDVWVNDFTTRIDVFDPIKLYFDIPAIQVNGIRARIYQVKPLLENNSMAQDVAEARQPINLNLKLKQINLQNIDLDYRNDVSAFYNAIKLGQLDADASNVDLPNLVIDLDKLHLDKTTAFIRLGNKEQAKVVAKQIKQEVVAQAQNNWRIRVKDLELNDNDIRFDDDTKPRLAKGMDYSHLKAENVTLHADDLFYSIDTISARITKGSFAEKSGFKLNRLETNFLFAAKEAYLKDLVLETPGTRITRSIHLNYPSLDAVAKNPATLQLNVDLDNSKVQVKDILAFVPSLAQQPAFANPSGIWLVDGRVNGTTGKMTIDHLQFRGLTNTRVDVSGTLTGMPDVNKIRGNLNIRNLTTNKTDLALFIPKNTLPQNITLPDQVSVNGTVNGGMQDVITNLNINSSMGNATVKGRIQQPDNPKAARYALNLSTRGLQLGRILQNDMLGAVSADLTANGRGFDPDVAAGSVKGVIHSAVVKNYNYKNVRVDGNIAGKKFTANTSIHDPNIDLTLNATGVLTDKYPSLKLTANIDSLKTKELNLTTNVVIYRGNIDADFANTDPDNLDGRMLLTHSVLVNDTQRIQLDTLQVIAGRNDTVGRYLHLTSDVAWASLEGEYKLTEIGYVIQNSIQPHFALVPAYKVQPVSPYNFKVNASVLDRPLLRSFMPDLKQMHDLALNGSFSSTSGWSLTANSPLIVYGPNTFVDLNLRAGSAANGIDVTSTLSHLQGSGFNVYGVNVGATVANNQVNLTLNIKNRVGNDKYHFTALMRQPTYGNYVFSLEPQQLLLNYETWTVAPNNTITFTPDGFNVSNFVLSKNNQQLSINSATAAVNASINVNFSSFKLGTITGFMQADTSFVDGVMNGSVVLKDVTKQLIFTSDLTVNDLSVRGDTVGNAVIRVNNTVADRYDADVKLTGRGNDLAITGNYLVKPGNASTYNLILDIRQLQLNTIEGATMGSIKDASGVATGRFTLNGTADNPHLNGNLVFNNAAMNVTALNSKFKIDQERIDVDNEGIHFNTFTVKDEAGNPIIINGIAGTSNFVNYRFDMSINADNFMAVNTTRKESKLFYGKLVMSTNLRIRGSEEAPSVDGNITVNKATDFTVVLPQEEPGVVTREGIVEFVDMDAPRVNDTLFKRPYMALDTSSLRGVDLSANIEVDKEATLSMVIDAGNGDFVRMKGEGLITAGIDPSGKITLTGSYEIQEGTYEITFNFLQRKFNIQKGSKIIWQGEPTDARVAVNAVYVANASPLDLVDDQLAAATSTIRNTYRQRLPFEVHLSMQGELLKPDITFDIELPEKNYGVSNDIIQNVTVKLDQLRQEPSELNKQVFALLLMNRFVGENPFASSGSSPFNASSFARQSASKLLTEQLNKLAENLVQGVDINFDVSSIDDYTTGERRNKTDFNVSLSKNLLSERLRVTVGSNFELEGPNQSSRQSNLAGDVAVDYKLSKDGRYLLRGYRKNEWQGVVEGYIIETGLSFIITVDYNKFAEIFRRKKNNKLKPAAAAPPPTPQPQQQPGNEPINRQ